MKTYGKYGNIKTNMEIYRQIWNMHIIPPLTCGFDAVQQVAAGAVLHDGPCTGRVTIAQMGSKK